MAGPLWADSVSNLRSSSVQGAFPVHPAFPSAQGFTTGSNSGGYTLKSVTLTLRDNRTNNTDNFTLSLYSAASNGKPSASLATLAPPSGDISGRNVANYTFTCGTGCQLAGDNTTYFIVLEPAGGTQYYWYQDTSPNQTNTPADGGWSIADVAQVRSGGTWSDESPILVKQMSVSYVGPDLLVENISQTESGLEAAQLGGNKLVLQAGLQQRQRANALQGGQPGNPGFRWVAGRWLGVHRLGL